MRTKEPLTADEVAAITEEGLHCCGQRLYLSLSRLGRRKWCYRYRHDGEPRVLWLGDTTAISYERARELIAQIRKSADIVGVMREQQAEILRSAVVTSRCTFTPASFGFGRGD